MSKKKENPFKIIAILLATGIGIHLIFVLVCAFIGWILSLIFGWDWFITSVIIFCIINAFEALDSEGESKCTECKRKILTSRSIKCEVCGGPARLTEKEYKKVVKKEIYKRKNTT